MKLIFLFLTFFTWYNSYYSFIFNNYFNNNNHNHNNHNHNTYTLIQKSGFVKTLMTNNKIIYNKIYNESDLDTIISNKSIIIFYICNDNNNNNNDKSNLTSFNIAKYCCKNNVSRLIIVSSSYNKIKTSEEFLINQLYNHYNNNHLSYTIIKTGYIINGLKRGSDNIEICSDYSKSGIITRADLIDVCINSIYSDYTKNKIFEVFYKNKNKNFYKYIINKYFKLSRNNDNQEIDNNNNYTHLFLKLKS